MNNILVLSVSFYEYKERVISFIHIRFYFDFKLDLSVVGGQFKKQKKPVPFLYDQTILILNLQKTKLFKWTLIRFTLVIMNDP